MLCFNLSPLHIKNVHFSTIYLSLFMSCLRKIVLQLFLNSLPFTRIAPQHDCHQLYLFVNMWKKNQLHSGGERGRYHPSFHWMESASISCICMTFLHCVCFKWVHLSLKWTESASISISFTRLQKATRRHLKEGERFIRGSVQCYTRSVIPTMETVERRQVGRGMSSGSKNR